MHILETSFYQALRKIKSSVKQCYVRYMGGQFVKVDKTDRLGKQQKPLLAQLEYFTDYSRFSKSGDKALSLYDIKRMINLSPIFLSEFSLKMLSIFNVESIGVFPQDVRFSMVMLSMTESFKKIDQLVDDVFFTFLSISEAAKKTPEKTQKVELQEKQTKCLVIARYYIAKLVDLELCSDFYRVKEECSELLRIIHPDKLANREIAIPDHEGDVVSDYGKILILIRQFMKNTSVELSWSTVDSYPCFKRANGDQCVVSQEMLESLEQVDLLTDEYADELFDIANESVEADYPYENWNMGLCQMINEQKERVSPDRLWNSAIQQRLESVYCNFFRFQLVNGLYMEKVCGVINNELKTIDRRRRFHNTGVHLLMYSIADKEKIECDWRLVCQLLATWKEQEWSLVQSGDVFSHEKISDFIKWQKHRLCWCADSTLVTPVVAGKVFDKIIEDMNNPPLKISRVSKSTSV
ncbi:hypothetical protein [Kistimonas asteriae]|uniref:hypothetical protein n=1 Tax=Kistimonas asteriae TaxID=517724 RepID=UPI001BA43D92|nr:hypothetical protein [Kistimonas asteriae]